jgi:hypothetical protein
MSDEYRETFWIRSHAGTGRQVGLMRRRGTARTLTGHFVNQAGEWEQDNARLAELTGVGGDSGWDPVTVSEARAFLRRFLPEERVTALLPP